MTQDEKLADLAEYLARAAMCMRDVAYHLNNAAECLQETEGETKQRRVRESMREDAIDELLKREGFSW